ncbi:hypothetical protein [Palleronia abyssalis]|uniref:Uncharacterized protein n=1 Tax=Palleronia abyssalis TaxID=1501240 RepID=A0A2R8BSI0_9RHOB|nr:hypothetical protein [Palleronia abyssalis]SPJ23091.1 hypothetical protein PAA8504_00896 [Palleronia abyssalis]
MFRTALLLSLVCAQPAFALSCLAPSVAQSTREAVQSDERYRIVLGTFTYDEVSLPADGTQGRQTSIPAVFEGDALTLEGFDDPTKDQVVLQVECITNVCGSITPGVPTLAFLRQDGDDVVLDVNACPQWVFTDPSSQQIATVVECITGEGCPVE